MIASLVVAAGAVAESRARRPSAGCGVEPAAKPGTSIAATLDFQQLEREYRLHTPDSYDAARPVPLVLVIHGYMGTAERLENEYTSFSQHADEHGYVVAYPQATGFEAGDYRITSWNDLACNASPGPEGPTCMADADDYPTPPECGEPRECDWCSCHDDVGFVAALLDEIQDSYCVDLDRVYATGISNGGMFVQRLGCDLSERFTAIAPVAGTLAKGFACAAPASPKTSILNFYGTEDRVVPFDGTPASDGFLYSPTSQVMAAWAAGTSQGCDEEDSPYATSRDGVAGLECRQHANCATRAEVVDCAWDGDHDWPRRNEDEFGIDVIWEFFEKNSRSEEVFQSASSVEEVRRQIERVPADTSWWMVNGEDMAWNNKNLNRIFPTVNVYRAGPVRELEYRPMLEIANFLVDTPGGQVLFRDFLNSDESTNMGLVILHRGSIVFEDYPRMEPYERPIYWSVTKVMVSTVLSVLEARGEVDIDKSIETYLPALAGSSWAGIKVRNILDMASGVDCSEEYYDKSSCYYRLMETIGESHWTESSADNPYEFLATVKVDRFAEQGTAFEYSGSNTYILGWLVEELTGMPFQDAFSREVWTQIGAEGDAAILAPRYGVPMFAGGLLARLRDVARFGLLFTPSYSVVADRRIISEEHIELLESGGNPQLLANARWGSPEGLAAGTIKHNVYQWDLVFSNNDIFKGGWAGQGLLINPDRDLVAVWVGYFNDDQSELSVLPRLRQVLEGVFGEAAAVD